MLIFGIIASSFLNMCGESTVGVRIVGTGIYLPERVVDNQALEAYYPTGLFPEYKDGGQFDWNAKWIEKKLGIQSRHFAFDFTNGKIQEGYYDLDMGEKAARSALANSSVSIEDIDAIIYVSSTPEYLMPDPACMLHLRLAAREDTAAFGLTSVGCGGCVYGMINAASLIDSGRADTVLIVASTSVSSYMTQYGDPNLTAKDVERFKVRDRFNASMFGDGAGAMIFQRNDDSAENALVDTYWGATGLENPVIFEAGGSRNPATIETVRAGLHFFNMDGQKVKSVGPILFEKTIHKILKKTGMKLSDINHFVLHQVNHRILTILLDRMGIPQEKASIHVNRYGNLDTATLAVGYHEAIAEGKIKSGDLVLFAAIGAGWQFGSAIYRV